jgi:glucose-6-phosphate 1-dehydrogenase
MMANDAAQQKKPEGCSFVIFGVTGDLAHRLIIPALYNLATNGLLPDNLCVVGVTRKGMSNDELRNSLLGGLREFATRPVDNAVAQRLLECVTCIAADPNDSKSFENMREQLDKIESKTRTGGNRLFYLATPPNAFAPISRELGRSGMLREDRHVAAACYRKAVWHRPFVSEGSE